MLQRKTYRIHKKQCIILQAQPMFKSERHNNFTEEINKVALSLNDDKRMQSTDLKKSYAYELSKYLVSEEEF